jgi:hypothetical protein
MLNHVQAENFISILSNLICFLAPFCLEFGGKKYTFAFMSDVNLNKFIRQFNSVVLFYDYLFSGLGALKIYTVYGF